MEAGNGKAKQNSISPGSIIGEWTVLYEDTTAQKERRWVCKCSCGTEKSVLDRSLRYGGSSSCGCIAKKNAAKANSYDLTGQTFGELTVLRKAEHQRKNGGVWWTCHCSCGNLYDAPASLLKTGRRTHCASEDHPKNYFYSDITGRKVGRLTALYPLKLRSQKGAVIWHCKCDCGNEVDVSYNELMYSEIKSCGCWKRERESRLSDLITRVDGTSIDMIKSKKLPSDNTSGVKGVYYQKGKWIAKIVFQKKQYHLGKYDTIKDAARVRHEAEEILFDGVAAHYELWQDRASRDPQWAEENPIEITVSKKSVSELQVIMLPELV